MGFILPKIYPITDTVVSGLSHCEQARQLIEAGATFVQLREKRASARSFLSEAAEARDLFRAAGATLIINDRVDIALAVQADGVHLGQFDMPVEAARRLLGVDAIIGLSTHNLNQVKTALELPINYLAFGPVYPTKTKENPDPIAGITGLRRAKSLARSLPVVAIGGINQSNLQETLAAGADAVAVIAAVLTPASQIAQNLRDLTNIAATPV